MPLSRVCWRLRNPCRRLWQVFFFAFARLVAYPICEDERSPKGTMVLLPSGVACITAPTPVTAFVRRHYTNDSKILQKQTQQQHASASRFFFPSASSLHVDIDGLVKPRARDFRPAQWPLVALTSKVTRKVNTEVHCPFLIKSASSSSSSSPTVTAATPPGTGSSATISNNIFL